MTGSDFLRHFGSSAGLHSRHMNAEAGDLHGMRRWREIIRAPTKHPMNGRKPTLNRIQAVVEAPTLGTEELRGCIEQRTAHRPMSENGQDRGRYYFVKQRQEAVTRRRHTPRMGGSESVIRHSKGGEGRPPSRKPAGCRARWHDEDIGSNLHGFQVGFTHLTQVGTANHVLGQNLCSIRSGIWAKNGTLPTLPSKFPIF